MTAQNALDRFTKDVVINARFHQAKWRVSGSLIRLMRDAPPWGGVVLTESLPRLSTCIDGAWVAPRSGDCLETVDPPTGGPRALVPRGDAE